MGGALGDSLANEASRMYLVELTVGRALWQGGTWQAAAFELYPSVLRWVAPYACSKACSMMRDGEKGSRKGFLICAESG